MIEVALLAGLAGLWVWAVLNDEDGFFKVVPHYLYRWHWSKKWLECPWCSGAWFSAAASIAVYHPSVVLTIVTALAAAAVCGVIGMYVGGME